MDDENCRQPHDIGRVNVEIAPELLYWCKQFNCSAEEIRAAVAAIGVMTWDVQAFLQARLAQDAMIERFLSRAAKSKHPDLYAAVMAVTLAKFLTNCIQVVVDTVVSIN
jgi:hypothetical protein